MTMKSGFHNSVNGDRTYNAEDMNRPYRDIISCGVFPNPSDQLQVFASNGMNVSVASGGGIFGNGWACNEGAMILEIEAAESTLPRIDAVVVHRDESEDVRDTSLIIKKGTPATNPVRPTMLHTDYIDEYCLATVYVSPGTTAVTQAIITDTRPDTEVCGWVTGLIDQVDTSTLFKQWESAYWHQYDNFLDEFQAWWTGIRNILLNDQTAAAEILLLKQEKADRKTAVLNLSIDGWKKTGDYYNQDVAVEGLKANDIVMVAPHPANYDDYSSGGIMCSGQGEGKLTFRSTLPLAVKVNLVNLGV